MSKQRLVQFFTGMVVFILAISTLFLLYSGSRKKDTPLIFAKNQMLSELWSDYKRTNIEPDTFRTLDKQQNFITTSEGEGYTMERAVWQDDKNTFDRSWQWTKDNLQRPDHLLSWKFGQLPNQKYGIQSTVGGNNTATDGDTDIALSLLMAYNRWKQDRYLYDAKPLINSIWEKEVVVINNHPVLVADDLERLNTSSVIVNPSYFSPYTYKIFSLIDTHHDWKGLTDNSYELLNQVSMARLDKSSSAGVPPDWIRIDRHSGEMSANDTPSSNQTTNFGFDAMRTPWRLALDWNWFKDERDKQVLSKYNLLLTKWNTHHHLDAIYAHDGSTIANYEASPAIYGGTLGYFMLINPTVAKDIYLTKLNVLYSPDEQKWKKSLSYYDDNWAWFGMALYLNQLPNLTTTN
ncbi:MAG: hypothetical protein NVSMB46_06260 [Candidatus Saccharimonadales bacterium]